MTLAYRVLLVILIFTSFGLGPFAVGQICCTIPASETSTAVGPNSPYSPSEFFGKFSATVTDQVGTSFDSHYVNEGGSLIS